MGKIPPPPPLIGKPVGDYEFEKFFWSYVIKNIKVEKLRQNIKIDSGYSNMKGAIDGTPISNSNYVAWFVKNIQCISITLDLLFYAQWTELSFAWVI